MADSTAWTVLKFGGTSVSTRWSWETLVQQVEDAVADGFRPVVVCSALSGVSDLLESVMQRAPRGEHETLVEEVRARHRELADALEVDGDALLQEEFRDLERLARGVELLGEVSPGVQARIMALGELMSTRLGAAFMRERGTDVGWLDARGLLTSNEEASGTSEHRRFLSATASFEDDGLSSRLAERTEPAFLTQGFIASDPHGRTVLLGRGGSDASAAYLAAKLAAAKIEIWTDVPGMFTADPRPVPQARLLRHLDYDEAQELATMGAKALHPSAVPPLREASIPLEVRCTPHPELDRTRVSSRTVDDGPRVKAISAKKGITAVSMDTLGMWQEVGFLAEVFAIFKRNGLSIDLMATSESNVTVTLDPSANALDQEILHRLTGDLEQVCRARILEGCAVVSLVGRKIRSILSRLAPALEVFEEHRIHLMSQAASDLNLSLVVDEEQADRLVERLHALLFGDLQEDAVFGPRYGELVDGSEPSWHQETWWRQRSGSLRELARRDAPVYVYDEATLNRNASALRDMEAVDRVFYAMKANPHPGILQRFDAWGLGFECVSPGELERVEAQLGRVEGERLLFTPNFASREEYRAAFDAGATVTLDSLFPLQEWPEVFEGREVLVRVDPGQGHGHHPFVRTAGPRAKFGVLPEELPEVRRRAKELEARVVGLHAHVGSGVRDPGVWSDTAVFLASFREHFPEVRALNLGGGLGVPERPGERPLDLEALDEALAGFKEAHPDVELWLEPGRFLVAEAGVLLVRVTQLKTKGSVRYVGVETGMNSLIRPALYGAHHRIVNLSRIDDDPDDFYEVVGPICENGDVLGRSRRLARPRERDVLLVANAGAYGSSMSSHYNLRRPAAEFMLPEG